MSNRNFPTREFLRTFLFPFFFPLSLRRGDEFFTNWNDAGSKTKSGEQSEEDGTSVQCLHGN